MKTIFTKTLILAAAIGLYAFGYQAQLPVVTTLAGPAAFAGEVAVETLNAVVENKSRRNVLIWQDGFGPKKLVDVVKFHLEPGWKTGLKVTLGANSQIRFIAGAGSSSGPDYGGDRLGSCTWTRNPKTPKLAPYVIYNGSGLSCGSIAR